MNEIMLRQYRREARKKRILGLATISLFAVLIIWSGLQPRAEAETPQVAQVPEKICVWGENKDGSCRDLDPCEYSNVTCSPETRKEQRITSIEDKIRAAAHEYGLDPDQAVMIAQCESSLNERASNPSSTAKGVYQFTDGTWAQIKAQGHQFDADENIKQFMIWYPIHPDWWVCE